MMSDWCAERYLLLETVKLTLISNRRFIFIGCLALLAVGADVISDLIPSLLEILRDKNEL
jgi:hypothetical protein